MKKIFIPVAIVVAILMIVAIILSKTTPANENPGYHTHADGQTHYDTVETSAQEYHVHDDGETHYGTH